MFCQECGNKISEDQASVCPSCNSSLSESVTTHYQPAQESHALKAALLVVFFPVLALLLPMAVKGTLVQNLCVLLLILSLPLGVATFFFANASEKMRTQGKQKVSHQKALKASRVGTLGLALCTTLALLACALCFAKYFGEGEVQTNDQPQIQAPIDK